MSATQHLAGLDGEAAIAERRDLAKRLPKTFDSEHQNLPGRLRNLPAIGDLQILPT
jgi:hypothetical protein